MMRSALEVVSAWASAGATGSAPARPLLIILLTALPPAPPHPNTVIRGFNSDVGSQIDGHGCLPLLRVRCSYVYESFP
jgi:hypothetical protein